MVMTGDINKLIDRRAKLLTLSEPYQRLIDEFRTDKTDVTMITPPKCGSHNGWVAQVLHQIRTGGDEDFDDLLAQVPQLHCLVLMSGYPIHCAQNGSPRLFRSHEAIPLRIDNGNQGKVIFVSGDPYDTFYCWQRYMEHQTAVYDVDQSRFLDLVDKTLHVGKGADGVGDHGHGPPQDDYWAQIVHAWKCLQEQNPRFLWLHFHDLTSNLDACVERIAKFMGKPCTEELNALVRERTGAEYMKRHTTKFNFAALRNKRLCLIGVNPHLDSNAAPSDGNYVGVNDLKIGDGAALVEPEVKERLDRIWRERVESQTGVKNYVELIERTSIVS